MSKIHNGTGSSAQHQYSQRADGVWFVRYQNKGVYGYSWGKWTKLAYTPSNLGSEYSGKARLPRAT